MTGATLYVIRDDLQALEDLLLDVGGDVTDAEADAAIIEWLKETGEATRSKLDRYAALIREMEARSIGRKNEAKRLAELAQIDANAADRLKAKLLWFLNDRGQTKMETDRFRLTVCANGGKVPIQVLAEPAALPEQYRVVDIRPNLDAIREALDAGKSLSFATLGSRGQHLRIR